MRFINRVLSIIFLFLVGVGVTLALALPELSLTLIADAYNSLYAELAGLNQQDRLIMLGVAVAIDLVVIVLLFLEFRPQPKDRARIKLVGGGVAEITFNAIEQRLKQNIEAIPDVEDALATISTSRRRVKVSVDVSVSPEVNVPRKLEEVNAVIYETIRDQMGLQIGPTPVVRVRHGSRRRSVEVRPELGQRRSAFPAPPGRDAPPTRPKRNDLGEF